MLAPVTAAPPAKLSPLQLAGSTRVSAAPGRPTSRDRPVPAARLQAAAPSCLEYSRTITTHQDCDLELGLLAGRKARQKQEASAEQGGPHVGQHKGSGCLALTGAMGHDARPLQTPASALAAAAVRRRTVTSRVLARFQCPSCLCLSGSSTAALHPFQQ